MRKPEQIGVRMKRNYEDPTRYVLPRRTYTVIRVDGKAFHTFTRGMVLPFDPDFAKWMDAAAVRLCQEIQGAKFAYTQSDEVSLLLTDFDTLTTEPWMGGVVQKMASVAASQVTVGFYWQMLEDNRGEVEIGRDPPRMPTFDARVFTVPSRVEVFNYFLWRQQDAARNSISAVAQSLYSPKELHGKDVDAQHEMIHAKGKNWPTYPDGFKRGRMVCPVKEVGPVEYKDRRSGEMRRTEDVERMVWEVEPPPVFSQEPGYLTRLIPAMGEES